MQRSTVEIALSRARRWTNVRSTVARAVDEHRIVLGVFLLQVAVSSVLCTIAGRPLFVGLSDAYITIDAAVLIVGSAALAVYLVRTREPGLPLRTGYRAAWERLRTERLSGSWAASVGLLCMILPLSLAVFSAAKRAIPSVEPFVWDTTLERVSRELHGGRHAWQLVQPVVGEPTITVILDRYYHVGWSLIALGSLALAVVAPCSRLRRRFVTAWVLLTFFCGTIAALVFSSAGPPYFGRVVSGQADPYAPLRAYLRGVASSTPLLSVGGRRALWSAYQRQVDAFGFGISAMPSMHIATTSLVACLAFAVSPWLGVGAVAATLLMEIGSVALCWHYAIDGYAGAAMAVIVWFVADRLERGKAG